MPMAIAMAAMMTPTAVPFFAAFARDVKRPGLVAIVVVVYAAVWGLVGAATGLLMDRVMMPSSQLVAAAAIALVTVYALMPWSRWARGRCRDMCRRATRGDALAEGARYAGFCVLCSAGVMAALVLLGMSNVLLMAAAATAMLVYKAV